MGTDREQAAEFVATVRGDHVKMKTWYTEGSSEAIRSLKAKFGPYPSLWKEVLNWPGWKDARKEYLKQDQQSEPEIPKKRKSRWGSAPDASKRQSRWGNSQPNSSAPSPSMQNSGGRFQQPPPRNISGLPGMEMLHNLPPHKQQEMRRLQADLRDINMRMNNIDRDAARFDALPRGHRDRSPSPPPSKLWLHVFQMNLFSRFFLVYGPDGKRKNTRAVRWRERYSNDRQNILERIMNLNPNPHARRNMSNLMLRKRVKKIPIPIDKHPNYNFIGLIIGPRGKTQKELEAKTGCKIAIRGKGSVKEGAKGRRDGKVMEGDNEPLHVVISGDDQGAVDAAAKMMEEMLVVIDDEKNVHKQQQLRELALLNGTLKEDEFCTNCGEKGHRSFECPKRFKSNNRPLVKCAICGDTSHPTRDCTRRQVGGGATGSSTNQQIDSEYQSFMAELDGGKQAPNASQVTPASGSVPPPGLPPPPPRPGAAPPLPGPPPRHSMFLLLVQRIATTTMDLKVGSSSSRRTVASSSRGTANNSTVNSNNKLLTDTNSSSGNSR